MLEGSIRRQRDRIRVTAQLVSVRNEAPLWAGKFDELFTDIFNIEDRISEQLTRALMLKLTGEEIERLTKRHTESADAYQSYLKGTYFACKGTAEGARKAIDHFNSAIESDPRYALAFAGLADAYTWLSHFSHAPREIMPKAREASLKALELDATLCEAHYALAMVKMWYDWEWPSVEERFRRAIELNPNHAMARTWFAFYLTAMGRFDEALAELRLAQEVDPLSLLTYSFTGWQLYMMRRYDEAIAQFEKALEMDSTFHSAWWGMGWANIWKGEYEASIRCFEKARALAVGGAEIIAGLGHAKAKAGNVREAEELLDDLQRLSQREYVSPFYVALLYAGLGDKDRTLEALHKAYEDRFEWTICINVDPVWDFVRPDPRFMELLKRLNLAAHN